MAKSKKIKAQIAQTLKDCSMEPFLHSCLPPGPIKSPSLNKPATTGVTAAAVARGIAAAATGRAAAVAAIGKTAPEILGSTSVTAGRTPATFSPTFSLRTMGSAATAGMIAAPVGLKGLGALGSMAPIPPTGAITSGVLTTGSILAPAKIGIATMRGDTAAALLTTAPKRSTGNTQL